MTKASAPWCKKSPGVRTEFCENAVDMQEELRSRGRCNMAHHTASDVELPQPLDNPPAKRLLVASRGLLKPTVMASTGRTKSTQ